MSDPASESRGREGTMSLGYAVGLLLALLLLVYLAYALLKPERF
jgi:K+-transporting ATPase KdpF subunit